MLGWFLQLLNMHMRTYCSLLAAVPMVILHAFFLFSLS